MIAVCRPLDGITLNTEVEYLLDDAGEIKKFEDVDTAKEWLREHGVTEGIMEFFMFEEVMNIKDVYENLYPLTIVTDRYSGVYSGGKFTAWNLNPDEVPEEICWGDGSALEIFQDISNGKRNIVYGIGATPDEAVMDLYRKIK